MDASEKISRAQFLQKLFGIVLTVGVVAWLAKNALASFGVFRFKDATTGTIYDYITINETTGLITIKSPTTLTLAGATLTNVGVVGDVTGGDSTLRTWRPNISAKIDLGTTAYRFNTLCLEGDIDISSGNFIFDAVTGSKIGTSASQLLALWGATPAARPSAYTLTYSTAFKTHPAVTSTAVATNAATQVTPFGYATAAQADAIPVAINAVAADLLALKKFVNAMITDDKALGIKTF